MLIDAAYSEVSADQGTDKLWMDRLFPVNRSLAVKSIFGIWGAYFLFVSSRVFYVEQAHPDALFVQRILMTSLCLVFTWILYRMLVSVRNQGMGMAIFILFLPTMFLANAAAILDQVIFNHEAALFDFSYLMQPIDFERMDWSYILDEAFTRYFIFAGWGALYLALAHSSDVERMMEHSRELERVTRESELRALRYQLNPHFVFNALNSVSSLIIDQKNQKAEKLVDDLADYMRSVLNDDSDNMVTVEQEFDQQVRYLEIEKMRFPERLQFEVAMKAETREWKIPALIVQPLIENAIKYGVSQTEKPVRILLSSEVELDRLRISVANDGRLLRADDHGLGTGTGLTNIRERLGVLYGSSASLMLANGEDGMAIATLVIPRDTEAFQE